MWSMIIEVGSNVLHWLTGWIVHPEKGGCCEMDIERIVKKYKDQ